MKEVIKEYLELSNSEKKELWNNAVFVFDTNVMLNLYRYSKNTREQLLAAFNQLKDRVWIPYQVAMEFCKDRAEVIYDSKEKYVKLEKTANEFVEQCRVDLRLPKDNSDICELSEYISKWIKEKKENNLLVEKYSDDEIFEKLLKIFDGRVGIPFSETEKEQIEKEGKTRYEAQIPPGYKDAKKEFNKYGDLLVWKEILKYSKDNNKDIIFVTHDQKEDWWSIVHGECLGPRAELRKEFINCTGHRMHMYKMGEFLERCNAENKAKNKIDENTISEVKSISSIQDISAELDYLEKLLKEIKLQDNTHNALSEIQSLTNDDYLNVIKTMKLNEDYQNAISQVYNFNTKEFAETLKLLKDYKKITSPWEEYKAYFSKNPSNFEAKDEISRKLGRKENEDEDGCAPVIK